MNYPDDLQESIEFADSVMMELKKVQVKALSDALVRFLLSYLSSCMSLNGKKERAALREMLHPLGNIIDSMKKLEEI